MGIREDLIAAKALIDTPEKWGKGIGCYLTNSGPACAHEALRRAFSDHNHEVLRKNLKGALPPEWTGSVPEYNDASTTTHADIMALFDRAIAAAEVAS